jgi:hypothetical protein
VSGAEPDDIEVIRSARHHLLVEFVDGKVSSTKILRSVDKKEAARIEERQKKVVVEGVNGSKLLCFEDIVHNGKKVGIGCRTFDIDSKGYILVSLHPYRVKLDEVLTKK